jgi:hypothetical protein
VLRVYSWLFVVCGRNCGSWIRRARYAVVSNLPREGGANQLNRVRREPLLEPIGPDVVRTLGGLSTSIEHRLASAYSGSRAFTGYGLDDVECRGPGTDLENLRPSSSCRIGLTFMLAFET